MLATLAPPLHLSPRQVEVCVLVAAGETDKGVGRELGISPRTAQGAMHEAAQRIRQTFPHLSGSDRTVVRAWFGECRWRAYFQHREAA